jgi:tRNA/tmRNA/rRNA uracil-C5-methylase (TrmA/RlmC/RlmD family)
LKLIFETASSRKSVVSDHRPAYKRHLLQKASEIHNLLEKISGCHMKSEIIPTPIAKGYRNRAKYKIFGHPDKYEIRGTDPIQGEVPYKSALWMLPVWGEKLVKQVIDVISEKLSRFWVDGLEVQLSHGKRQAHATLSVKRQDGQSYAALAEMLLDKVPTLGGVSIPSKKQSFGKSFLLHNINGLDIFSEYSAFFQSNLCLTTKLVEDVRRKCWDWDFKRILDLYCGVGLFALSVAKRETPAVGVDLNKRAIDSARFNAKKLDFLRTHFFCCPVENFIQNSILGSDDLIIIDPPRTGCPASLIHSVSEQKPKYICSISCYLPTHRRDLELWIENGYSVRSLTAFDMFPFTEFLETVVFLTRNN